AVGRNLIAVEENLSAEFQPYNIPAKRSVEISATFDIARSWTAAASGSTLGFGALGTEINIANNLVLRSSTYLNKDETPKIYAFSVGMGWAYDFVEVDAGYLRFFGNGKHSAGTAISSADVLSSVSQIHNLDLNPYTQDRILISVKAIFGNARVSLARIQSVEMLSGVYPSSYELFAFRPIGRVKVKNVADKPIQAKASFYVEKFMDAPTESPSVLLMPGEEADIPFSAVLNDQMKSVSTLTLREGNVYVSTGSANEPDDRFQVKLLIHGRNDWDGDVYSLRHFVTPDEPGILRYTRDILLRMKDSLAAVPVEFEQLTKAKLLFNAFAGKLVYVGDPKQSGDYVQYPIETLTMQSGDCDDMTTCFVSLLSSIGISTAFIDVIPPQHPERSHIYLMFDSGVDPKFANRISENPKRYVVRKDSRGNETVWLPVETTVITKGFETAWETGAQEYLEDVEINLGIVKGWVRVVDVN
ncbi:MAG: transglutaminase-like domain-containing protein, partial [bacterium]